MEIWQAHSRGILSYGTWDRLGKLKPDLVLVFGSIDHFRRPGFAESLKEVFRDSLMLGCSTAGEIIREGALEGHVVVTAVKLQHPALRVVAAPLACMEDSRESGERLGEGLRIPSGDLPLRGVLLLGQGVQVNGSAIIQGLAETIGKDVPICGALAGDGGAFVRTFTLHGDKVSDRDTVALGFYGEGIELRTASAGGWMPFGPVRHITRAKDNVLQELDGEPALAIYRRYLGEWAKDLPGSGLLFPLCLLEDEQRETGLTRTLLGIDEAAGSLVMAGEMTEQRHVRLMHADTGGLVEGAREAARTALGEWESADLALLFSCVGRKLVMGGRVDEEVEAVTDLLKGSPIVSGFYSYGEIGPHSRFSDSKLHNQTMTVTLLRERS